MTVDRHTTPDGTLRLVARHLGDLPPATVYPTEPERLVDGSDLDHWIQTAGELSVVRDAFEAEHSENVRLRWMLEGARRVLGAEALRACMRTEELAVVENIEAMAAEMGL